jgi:Fe(3+) dicitrate transport protein
VDSYPAVDLVGHYRLGKPHSLYAKVDKFFDNTYLVSRRPYGARPSKPRTFTVGYKYAF